METPRASCLQKEMTMRNPTTILALALGLLAVPAHSDAQPPARTQSQAQGAGRYAQVNGLKMYYEVHGTGRPIVLVHGAFCTIQSCLGELVKKLSKSRQVIAVE